MKNRLTRSSRSQRGYIDSLVLIYSFGSVAVKVHGSRFAVGASVPRKASFGMSGVLAQKPALVVTFHPFDGEHEDILCQTVR